MTVVDSGDTDSVLFPVWMIFRNGFLMVNGEKSVDKGNGFQWKR